MASVHGLILLNIKFIGVLTLAAGRGGLADGAACGVSIDYIRLGSDIFMLVDEIDDVRKPLNALALLALFLGLSGQR